MKIIATIKRPHIEAAYRVAGERDIVVTSNEEFLHLDLATIKPEAIYFPHWSWIIPTKVVESYRCIIFHMTNLPYGRGGSPLQNLIIRGHKETVITAVLADKGVDTGNILLQRPLSLEGTADDIIDRSSLIIEDMIATLEMRTDAGVPQKGEVVRFKRRTPEESNLATANLHTVGLFYDFVRMLDGEGYPRAFLDVGGLHIEFYKADQEGHGHFTVRKR